jgi:hypothetical protein
VAIDVGDRVEALLDVHPVTFEAAARAALSARAARLAAASLDSAPA